MSALWRFARWQIESRLQEELVVEWFDGAKLVARNGMTGATGNIYCGLHEFSDMAFLLHFLRPEDLFFDIGANVGSYTILASKVCNARTIAFEPGRAAMRALERNVEENGISQLVSMHAVAIGNRTGTVGFSEGFDTTNRVLATGSAAREVPVKPLDDFLDRGDPTLIKLDIEGHEAQALRGASETLRRPSLLAVETETADAEVVRILNAAGFQRCTYDPFNRSLHTENELKSANALFVRNPDDIVARCKNAVSRQIMGTCI